jgi:hypothetical protein
MSNKLCLSKQNLAPAEALRILFGGNLPGFVRDLIPSFKIKLALGARALSSGVYC